MTTGGQNRDTPRVGVVLSCYDRVDDLLAHLDILQFAAYRPKPVVAYLHEDDPPRLAVDLLRLPSPGFTAGPLISLIAGVRWAAGLGLEYVVFRNADDWLFNHDMTAAWIRHMAANDLAAAGYNWFSVGTFNDVTLNENILRVADFAATADAAERYFLTSDQTYNCEYKMAWWVRRTLPDPAKGFFRLPGREQEPGVGWEPQTIPGLYAHDGLEVPDGLLDRLKENNRFFNLEWQLIGCHDNPSRLRYWRYIRGLVPYADELERRPQFRRWLQAAIYNRPWNKTEPNTSRLSRQSRRRPVRTRTSLPLRLFINRSSELTGI